MKLPTDVAEEPDAHHQAGDARRRELGHRAQADRAEAQLAEGVEQVVDRQPHRADLHAAAARAARRRSGPRSPAPTKIRPERELGRASTAPPRRPAASRARRTPARGRSDEQRVHRLEPAARELPAEDRRSRVAIGEQVQRRAGLLEHRPEQRRGEEEDADDVEPLALLAASSRRRGTASRRRPTRDDEQQVAGARRRSASA